MWWLDSEEFDAAMARFRCAPGSDVAEVAAALEAVKQRIREEFEIATYPDSVFDNDDLTC
jgi:hypothetical protein